MRHHHTLHGTGLINRRTDQETTALHHWTRETESLTQIYLAMERKPGHRLETMEDQMVTN